MIAYEIDASGPEEVLRIVGARLGDCSEPIREVLTLGLMDARQEIVSQGALFGDGWAPMSPWTTIVAHALYGKTRDPLGLLDDTGGLLDSLMPGGQSNFLEASERVGSAGTDYRSKRTGFPIAAGQQHGTSRTFHVLQGHGYSETGIPARPFLGWHESRGDEYVAIFARHVVPEELV